MTPEEIEAKQEQLALEYLARLERGEWRDPETGEVKHRLRLPPRRRSRFHYKRLLSRSAAAVLLLLLAGCASAPTARELPNYFKPATAVQPLIAFQTAVAVQFENGGMDVETFTLIAKWTGGGLRVLRDTPAEWEAFARTDWPKVRSLIGPYEQLESWRAVFDSILQ